MLALQFWDFREITVSLQLIIRRHRPNNVFSSFVFLYKKYISNGCRLKGERLRCWHLLLRVKWLLPPVSVYLGKENKIRKVEINIDNHVYILCPSLLPLPLPIHSPSSLQHDTNSWCFFMSNGYWAKQKDKDKRAEWPSSHFIDTPQKGSVILSVLQEVNQNCW